MEYENSFLISPRKSCLYVGNPRNQLQCQEMNSICLYWKLSSRLKTWFCTVLYFPAQLPCELTHSASQFSQKHCCMIQSWVFFIICEPAFSSMVYIVYPEISCQVRIKYGMEKWREKKSISQRLMHTNRHKNHPSKYSVTHGNWKTRWEINWGLMMTNKF